MIEIGRNLDHLAHEFRCLLGITARAGVDNYGTWFKRREQFTYDTQFGRGAVGVTHVQVKIGTIESGYDASGIGQTEQTYDVILDLRRGSGGQRSSERIAESGSRVSNVQVIGAEVVSPLGDAVSLINGNQAYGSVVKRLKE